MNSDLSVEAPEMAPAMSAPTRPLYWSVRRELWENPSTYLAPLGVAAMALFGFFISTFTLRHRMRAILELNPGTQRGAIGMPFDVVAFLLLLTSVIVGGFYCIDALYGERRERSILFWKSLPVSDVTAVLSKASIPLVILPLFSFVIIAAACVVMLLLSTVALLGERAAIAAVWSAIPLFRMWIALLYTLIVAALWLAPIYAWFLLISAWARRTPLLWALLPQVGLAVFERIAFRTSYIGQLMRYRMVGWFTEAFVPMVKGRFPADPLAALDPGKFLISPGLWLGLIFAALFIAGAVRLRRYREPI